MPDQNVPVFRVFYIPDEALMQVAGQPEPVHRSRGWYAQSLHGTTCLGPFKDQLETARKTREFIMALATAKEEGNA